MPSKRIKMETTMNNDDCIVVPAEGSVVVGSVGVEVVVVDGSVEGEVTVVVSLSVVVASTVDVEVTVVEVIVVGDESVVVGVRVVSASNSFNHSPITF